MSEADEMYEGIESVIKDLIEDYEHKYEYYECEKYWNLGAVEALEELLRRLNN